MNNLLKDLTLLYVEDESETREHFLFYLEDNFKKIIIATDGQDGLNKFKEKASAIDIIISDIQMPKMDGLKMIYEIKKLNRKIPCILTTAHNDSEYLLEAIELGIVSYLTKPINIDTLFKKIELAVHTFIEERNITVLLEKFNYLDKNISSDEFISVVEKTISELSQKQIIKLNNHYIYDNSNKILKQDKKKISLTNQEILIVEHLIKHKNNIVMYDTLTNLISPNLPSIETLRTNIKSIRHKTYKKFIINLSGVGYKIETI